MLYARTIRWHLYPNLTRAHAHTITYHYIYTHIYTTHIHCRYSLNEPFDPDEEEPPLPAEMLPAFAFLAVLDEAYFTQVLPTRAPPAAGTAMHMIAAGAGDSSTGGSAGGMDIDGAAVVLQLERRALARATELGYTLAFTTCTNHVTAVVSEHELGFRRAIAHSARAFEFDGRGHVFTEVPLVHEQCAVYDKVLQRPPT